MLNRSGRWIRGLVTLAVLIALLAGTVWGDDDAFPFGPFRMYSITNKASGEVASTYVEVRARKRERVRLDPAVLESVLGLRRAEIEGQLPRFVEDPEELGYIVEAYERTNPEGPALVELRLMQDVSTLRDGRVVDTAKRTLVVWHRS